MIKTIIFDIGNVLVGFEWKKYIQSFGFTEEVAQRISNATVLSKEWDEFDRGAMEDEEIIRSFVKNDPEIETEIRKICENVHDMLTRRAYAIPWIQELKEKGYQVLYLSNFSKKAETECGDVLDFLPFMDGGIMSYKYHLIKPQPEIYQTLLKEYGLVAEECVFMDDREDNCQAAKNEGIHAIVFTTKEDAEKQLAKLGVL